MSWWKSFWKDPNSQVMGKMGVALLHLLKLGGEEEEFVKWAGDPLEGVRTGKNSLEVKINQAINLIYFNLVCRTGIIT